MKKDWFSFIFIILFCFPAEAGAIAVHGKIDSGPIGKNIEVYYDKTNSLTIKDIVNPAFSGRFERQTRKIPILGFYPDTVWGRFTLENDTSQNVEIVLEHRHILTERFTLFVPKTNGYSSQIFDKNIKNEISIAYRNPIFQVKVPPGKNQYYFKLEGIHKSCELHIWSKKQFRAQMPFGALLPGLFTGGFIILVIYSLILFATLKDFSQLHFTVLMLAVFLIELNDKNILLDLNPTFRTALVIIASISSVMFARSFMKIASYDSIMDRQLKFTQHLGLLSLFASITASPEQSGLIIFLFTMVAIFMIALALVKGYLAGTRESRHLIYTGIPLLLGGAYASTIVVGITPAIPSHEWILMSTLLLQIIAFSISQADYMIENKKAEASAIETRKAASAVQSGLLNYPGRMGIIECFSSFRSAENMGGDWFGHYLDPTKTRTFILIGDVSGHGVSSALVSAAVAGAIQATINDLQTSQLNCYDAVNKLASVANSVVQKIGGDQSGLWMSMSIIAFDNSNLQGIYLNAGHPQIYLIKRNDLIRIHTKGSLLGSHSRNFGTLPLQFETGDKLFLFTDGLLENSSSKGRRYSISKLIRQLQDTRSAKNLIRVIELETEKLWVNGASSDDCTLLTVEILDYKLPKVS